MSHSIRRFWWSGKGSAHGWPLVAWDDICLPKATDGIGFKDHLFNIALLGKQIWRLLSAPGSLLYRTLRAKYFPDGDLFSASAPARSSFSWKGLHRAMLHLRDGFYWTLGIDSQVRSFGWRCGREALPVGSRLQDAGLSDGACPLCGVGFEDVLHVLRDCPNTSTALRQASFANSLLSARLCIGVCLHPGSIKVNVDGAFLPSARLGAIGVIARDSSGAVLCGFAKLVPVHGPASTVKDSALFAGLEFAIAIAWPSALIESDAAVLVNKLHRPTADLSLLGDMLAPSRALLAANAARLRVGFTSRLANNAAHTLASWACHNNDVISFSSICPELTSRIVLDDLSSSF
ncbi:hypothetical protein GQ457_07G006180 [Hibiscus cannabinus]